MLFYLQTQLIFALPGTDFAKISYLLAIAVFVGLPGFSYLIKYLYPEKEFRLEVHFLISLFVCIIGLITTVNGNVTYSVVKESVNVRALVAAFSLFAASFIIGFAWDKVKWRIKQNKESKNK